MTIQELARESHALAREKGWYEDGGRSVPEALALIHSEVSEALEAYREQEEPLSMILFEGEKPVGFAVELADVLIRLADTAACLGINLEEAVRQKMAYNRTRPHRHGGKRC